LLGPDDVHDALPRIVQPEEMDAVLRSVRLEIAHHRRNLRIGDLAVAPARRHVMIGDAEGKARLGDLASALSHFAESVKGAFVHIVPVDPEQRSAVFAARDLMRRP